jgi:hypothetical protein
MKNCLRCKSELKEESPSHSSSITFYNCPSCHSGYAIEPGQQLHDRWLMPLTLPLYAAINDPDPVPKAHVVARSFIKRETRDDLDLIKKHIIEELANPTQKVSEIHDFGHKNEDKLREFLQAFIDELNKKTCN